jgi:hypothetical protein
MSSISSLSNTYLQSILSAASQSTPLNSNTAANLVSSASKTQPADSNQLSSFAQLLSTLQQLQQSDPTQYQQVTQQIATNLKNAAQTATTEGNSTAAAQLNQLASDFSTASQNGQLPNIQDLSQAVGGSSHHQHHHHQAQDSSASSSTSNQSLNQLLSTLQANGPQNDSLNPLNIIVNTLSSAGIATSTTSST